MPQDPVVVDLGRRARFAELAGVNRLEVREPFVPTASTASVVWRALRWAVAFAAYALGRASDRVRGDRSLESKGRRLREVFERMGGTAIKIGQQLAVRVDFLPFEICRELGRLMDRVPPFPFEDALRRIERAAGVPASEAFSEIERAPIGSASIACVFRARRRDGRRVAIKVRRPSVGEAFAADMRLFGIVTRALEALTVVRADFFKYLRSELTEMLFDELDFVKEANHQTMFRRYAKRDRLRYVTAPRVHFDLSNHEVLASDFVEGYGCQDVLAAVERKDAKALATLASVGIDPSRVGRRIMALGYWSRLECPFFHADPHPGNILVLPGDDLVLLDFGCCGLTARKNAEHQIELNRRLMNDDLGGASAVSISILAPLPAVDVEALRRKIQHVSWEYHIKLKTKESEWWERTSAAIWISMIECTKEFNLPVNIDVLRLARSSLLFDTLACRLDPSIDAKNSFKDWLRASSRRGQRRAERRGNRAARAGFAMLVYELDALAETAQKGAFWLTHMTRELPKDFVAAQSKAAFFATTMLRAFTGAALLVAAAALGLVFWEGYGAAVSSHGGPMRAVMAHPAAQLLVALTLIGAVRRVQARLAQKETRTS